ncbi:MAG: universal stress protein [Syntrophobacteraceae bacterium]
MAFSEKDKILVATDGSEHSLRNVKYVSSILHPKRFEVVLFHVLTRVPESFVDLEKIPTYNYRLVSVESWEKQQEKTILQFMEDAEQILLASGFPKDAVTVKVQERKIGIARDVAAESQNGYKALVVGRKGLSELKDFMLGSIANKILELVPIPMWIVAGPQRPRKILLGMDNSEGAMLAVRHLAEMLDGSTDCDVVLFHAVRAFTGFRKFIREVFASDEGKATIESIEKELSEATNLLSPSFDKARATLVAAGIAPARIGQRIASCTGNCGNAVMEEAERGGYDTIVVGRRGLSKVEEFTMGRVSTKVIHMAREQTVWVVN